MNASFKQLTHGYYCHDDSSLTRRGAQGLCPYSVSLLAVPGATTADTPTGDRCQRSDKSRKSHAKSPADGGC
ncbi:hypothetical protein HMPREF3198_01260 [Winkia neuii]|nr:hypothetical protein HMPREF3198_01260 [Winkia neuii]